MKFKHQKYTYTPDSCGIIRHVWETVGPRGAVHFTVLFYKTENAPSCSIEFHHFEAGDFFTNRAPDYLDCRLTGGRCWHDGSSTYAFEKIWPQISPCLECGDHGAILRLLEHEYNKRFHPEE